MVRTFNALFINP